VHPREPTVVQTARELNRGRHHAAVVALAGATLEDDPTDVPLRVELARALVGLKRDAEAQFHLSRCVELDTTCADAFRVLAEIAVLRQDARAAELFLRDAGSTGRGRRPRQRPPSDGSWTALGIRYRPRRRHTTSS